MGRKKAKQKKKVEVMYLPLSGMVVIKEGNKLRRLA